MHHVRCVQSSPKLRPILPVIDRSQYSGSFVPLPLVLSNRVAHRPKFDTTGPTLCPARLFLPFAPTSSHPRTCLKTQYWFRKTRRYHSGTPVTPYMARSHPLFLCTGSPEYIQTQYNAGVDQASRVPTHSTLGPAAGVRDDLQSLLCEVALRSDYLISCKTFQPSS